MLLSGNRGLGSGATGRLHAFHQAAFSCQLSAVNGCQLSSVTLLNKVQPSSSSASLRCLLLTGITEMHVASCWYTCL